METCWGSSPPTEERGQAPALTLRGSFSAALPPLSTMKGIGSSLGFIGCLHGLEALSLASLHAVFQCLTTLMTSRPAIFLFTRLLLLPPPTPVRNVNKSWAFSFPHLQWVPYSAALVYHLLPWPVASDAPSTLLISLFHSILSSP